MLAFSLKEYYLCSAK